MSKQSAGVVGEPFARVLRASRDELNARFAEARQRHPSLAGDELMGFLTGVVDPLVSAVAAACPDRSDAVALVAQPVVQEAIEVLTTGLRRLNELAAPRRRRDIAEVVTAGEVDLA